MTDDGDDIVDSYYTISGDIDLKGGANEFSNSVHGVVESQNRLFIGNGVFRNDGILSPGGTGVIKTTGMTGSYNQSALGRYTVDYDYNAGTADKLRDHVGWFDGDARRHSDREPAYDEEWPYSRRRHAIRNSFSSRWYCRSRCQSCRHGCRRTTACCSTRRASRAFLGAAIDFAKASELTPNQAAIGRSLNRALPNAEGATLDFMQKLLTLQGRELGAIYDSLVPTGPAAEQSEAAVAAGHFATEMMSCRVDGDQLTAAIREGECLWARARARQIDVDKSAGSAGSQSTVGSIHCRCAGGDCSRLAGWCGRGLRHHFAVHGD